MATPTEEPMQQQHNAVVIDDDDDDMADLFSFSFEGNLVEPEPAVDTRARTATDDSLLEMMASETPFLDDHHNNNNNKGTTTTSSATTTTTTTTTSGVVTDQETQEILDWLDGDTTTTVEATKETTSLEATPDQDPHKSNGDKKPEKKEIVAAPAESPTLVALPPVFSSLEQALHSDQSTLQQLRDLYAKQQQHHHHPALKLSATDRHELYCRMVNGGKGLDETLASSLADSFTDFSVVLVQDAAPWIPKQVAALSPQVAAQTNRPVPDCQADLTKLLLYYYFKNTTPAAAPSLDDNNEKQPEQAQNSEEKQDGNEGPSTKQIGDNDDDTDPLVPPVAATILATGIPVAAASVVLAQMIPNYMPLLALQPQERWEAALSLHNEFYMLASYHLPFLVYHLDRYWPGWHWPRIPQHDNSEASATVRGRNLQKRGQLPPSWLLSNWAGESNGGDDHNAAKLPVACVLDLWDRLLLTDSHDMPFFLALTVLQDAADEILLLTDQALLDKLQSILLSPDIANASTHVQDWWSRAQFLQSCTPESVIAKLSKSEDHALQQALQRRQERAEAALQARLEAEAAAHKLAQEEKADQARERLTRARLVAFYRKHAPEKETNIDVLMEKYAGRYEVLDAKVKQKYGEGFNPAVKPKAPRGPNMLLASMNQGLGRRNKAATEKLTTDHDNDDKDKLKLDQVSVVVSPAEVLPVICWSREATAARGLTRRHRHTNRKPLKFYLVDCRSEEAAQEQGKFPTALSLTPESLLDPDKIRENEDMFESLRAAVHIVVMGEGFSALPQLYTQKLSPNLEQLTREDDSRTNNICLFFIKQGFPFVSVLDGGFAAAHSWLVRHGKEHHLSASSVLIDYDSEASLFGQMETYQNASAKERTQRSMQKILDSSLVSMTRSVQRLERLTADRSDHQGRSAFKNPFAGRLGNKRNSVATETEKDTADHSAEPTDPRDSSGGMLKNPFAVLRRSLSGDDADSTEDKVETTGTATAHDDKSEPGAPPPTATSPSTNPFGRFRQGVGKATTPKEAKDEDATQMEAKPMNNPFKGIGAAFNTSIKTAPSDTPKTGANDAKPASTVPNVLKRNPFARFGGGGGGGNKQQQPKAPPEKTTLETTTGSRGGFAGLNQLRKSTMARMRSGGAAGETDVVETQEESIAFDALAGEIPTPSTDSSADVKQV